jgi:CHAT domain-containing protein
MVNRGRSVLAIVSILVPLLTSSCQSVMSVEEAKEVTTSFGGTLFVPPPRTITDITAILDTQERAAPIAGSQFRAAQAPPATRDPVTLWRFYWDRARAARSIGRIQQEVADLSEAARWVHEADPNLVQRFAAINGTTLIPELEILAELAEAEVMIGGGTRGLKQLGNALAKVPSGTPGYRMQLDIRRARLALVSGDFDTVMAASDDALQAYYAGLRTHPGLNSYQRLSWDVLAAFARAVASEVRGKLREAEDEWRQGIDKFGHLQRAADDLNIERARGMLVLNLVRQDRLLEAENEARAALLSVLQMRGRDSGDTAEAASNLAEVLSAQGRHAEAEQLLRAAVNIYEQTGSAPDSLFLASARVSLATTLVAQGRWRDALAEYEQVRFGLAGDAAAARRILSANIGYALALLEAAEPALAANVLTQARAQRARIVDEAHPSVAEVRGLFAITLVARGQRAEALREFAEATRILLAAPNETADDEAATRGARDQRLTMILTAYIGLLADVQGTPDAARAGVDPAGEAFRLAEVARGRAVQRALTASAARAAAKTPALADLVRREQDARKHIAALYAGLANALSTPTDQQDAAAIGRTRVQIDSLERARQALTAQIAREFPTYAQLLNPPPATVEQARTILRPGEAWLVTYVAQDRTYVWAIPWRGPIGFAAAPFGEEALASTVISLREALDPTAKTLSDIPEFDLARAHGLYRALLEPVASGWREAQTLLVVAHGPLGQLPFALLPTQPTQLPAGEQRPIFSNYRAVPWLVRTHAVAVLPSVASLVTLRALPRGEPGRRPFVGFGDPYFSEEQARRVAVRQSVATGAITLRRSPNFRGVDSSQLAMLPPLPETGEEIRSIALALNADLTRDVFLGERANEQTVKTLDLSGYRVIAFATHGLVPGDLDGLTQPALALSAPSVAKVEGDGLLTMEKILGLRLNADWVVLSACNTASSRGAGSEAISGLGRAFFYAGARALLVSSWPVETTSARALTTDLFRRQRGNPTLTRAKALQETMNALMDGPGFVDPKTSTVVFSYAHPIFWAPFALVGDGG